MASSNPFSPIIPDIWRTIRQRRNIKSEYRKIAHSIASGDSFTIEFDSTSELGGILERRHHRMISEIETDGYLGNDGNISLTGLNEDDQKQLKSKVRRQALYVSLRNLFTIVFWAILIVLLAAIGSNLSSYVGSLIQAAPI